MPVINVQEKFAQFSAHWTPHVISELNGQAVKLAKVKGEFVWHDHENEDELFLVYKGTLYLDFRDRATVAIQPGELYVVPKGVEHRPYTKNEEEVWLMLLEPIGTKHTGEVESELTVKDYKRI